MVATPLAHTNLMTRPARSGSARALSPPSRGEAVRRSSPADKSLGPASTVKPKSKRAVPAEDPRQAEKQTPVRPQTVPPAPPRDRPRSMIAPARSPSTPPEPPRPSSPPPMSSRPSQRSALPGGYVAPPFPNTPAPDFKVGDKAVHPAHGVGEVTAIEQREIGGTRTTFYILRILDNAMKVMVPTTAATQVGLRGIMSDSEADGILSTMRAREVAVDVQPWSRRFRVYTEMIKSGSAIEIAKVLRDMNRLKFDKELSFGERRLLDQARSLLLKELAFAKKTTEAEMADEIRRIFSA
jgi:CarD family transcriptional regulator